MMKNNKMFCTKSKCIFHYVFVSMLFRMYAKFDSIDFPCYSIDLCDFLAAARFFISYVIVFSFLDISIAFY